MFLILCSRRGCDTRLITHKWSCTWSCCFGSKVVQCQLALLSLAVNSVSIPSSEKERNFSI